LRLPHVFLDNRLRDGAEVISIMHPPQFIPRHSFLLEAESFQTHLFSPVDMKCENLEATKAGNTEEGERLVLEAAIKKRPVNTEDFMVEVVALVCGVTQ
jgi:hypothetical protein